MPMAHAERVDFCYWRKQMVVVFLGSLVFIMVMLSLFVTEVPLNGASAPVGFAASAITCSTWWCWMLWLSGAGFFGCLLFIMVSLFMVIVVAVVVALLQGFVFVLMGVKTLHMVLRRVLAVEMLQMVLHAPRPDWASRRCRSCAEPRFVL